MAPSARIMICMTKIMLPLVKVIQVSIHASPVPLLLPDDSQAEAARRRWRNAYRHVKAPAENPSEVPLPPPEAKHGPPEVPSPLLDGIGVGEGERISGVHWVVPGHVLGTLGSQGAMRLFCLSYLECDRWLGVAGMGRTGNQTVEIFPRPISLE